MGTGDLGACSLLLRRHHGQWGHRKLKALTDRHFRVNLHLRRCTKFRMTNISKRGLLDRAVLYSRESPRGHQSDIPAASRCHHRWAWFPQLSFDPAPAEPWGAIDLSPPSSLLHALLHAQSSSASERLEAISNLQALGNHLWRS